MKHRDAVLRRTWGRHGRLYSEQDIDEMCDDTLEELEDLFGKERADDPDDIPLGHSIVNSADDSKWCSPARVTIRDRNDTDDGG